METDYQAKIKLFQQRDFGEKFNVTFDFLKENFKPLFKILIIVEGPLIVIASILNILVQQRMFGVMSDPEKLANNPFAMMNVFGVEYAVLMILNIVIYTTLAALLIRYFKLYQTKEPSTIVIQDLLPNLAKDSLMIFATSIIVMIAFFMGLMAFVIPGIFLIFAFSLSFHVLIFEDTNAIDCISRSYKLTKGKWWSTFGLLVIAFIIQYIVTIMFSLPYIMAFGGWAFFNLSTPSEVFQPAGSFELILMMAASAVSMIGAQFAYTITYTATSFQYFNLRERKESFGLMQEIDNLDND